MAFNYQHNANVLVGYTMLGNHFQSVTFIPAETCAIMALRKASPQKRRNDKHIVSKILITISIIILVMIMIT